MDKQLKEYILELAKKNLRLDGRKLNETRKIEIKYNISKNAEGSALVKMGETLVVAGVKLEIGEPFPDTPDEGVLIVNAELQPIASPFFEPGAPGEESIELARIVDRGIRESGAIDVKKLCIKKGEKVWMVLIDIYIQNHGGNLIDASAIAALAALSKTKFPKVEGDKIKYGELTNKKLPIIKKPIPCTFGIINEYILPDPNVKEEGVLDARLTITMDEEGNVNAIQKGGIYGISKELVEKCVNYALGKTKEIRTLIK